MTLEKIRNNMDPTIYNYWISNTPSQLDINKAFNDLKKEIDAGILKDYKYHCELALLKSRYSEQY